MVYSIYYILYSIRGAFNDNLPGSRVSYFIVNLRAQKLNKAHTKRVNITGVQYLCGIWSFTRIKIISVKFFYRLSPLCFTSS